MCSVRFHCSRSNEKKKLNEKTSRTWMPKIGTHKFTHRHTYTSTQGERMPKHRLRYAGANKNYCWRIKRIKRMNEWTNDAQTKDEKNYAIFFSFLFNLSIAYCYWIFHHYFGHTFIHPPTHNGTKRYLRYSHILRVQSINYKVVVPKFTSSIFMWVCAAVYDIRMYVSLWLFFFLRRFSKQSMKCVLGSNLHLLCQHGYK